MSRANLNSAILFEADLSEAHCNAAQFVRADLSKANLALTDLRGADLRAAMLCGARLIKAKLGQALLVEANFVRTSFREADLEQSKIGYTIFADVDLRGAVGLETIEHRSPSTVSIDTILRSEGKLPGCFLRGCGVPEVFVEYAAKLADQLAMFYSAFISYSSRDQAIAERLHADLQSKGVRCWFAPEDLKIGDKFRVTIDETIRVYDRLLLVLSENSIRSDWVEKEVETALEKEREQKRTMLFPIRIDDAVDKIKTGWPADIRRTRNIGDFRNWEKDDAYQQSFERLLSDLKAEAKTRS